MTQCNYIYASGLRLRSGDGVVLLDGKLLRVVRDGKGRSRLDRNSERSPTDGEITLRDLRAALEKQGESSIKLEFLDNRGVSLWSATLDPKAAMGRQGRRGDFKAALDAMTENERLEAATHQIKTLPYSDKAGAEEARARLAAALEVIAVTDATEWLPPEFGMFASIEQLQRALDVARPQDALRFASRQMSDEQFEKAVASVPGAALVYAAGRLTDEQFATAIAPNAWAALRYATDRLTDEQFARAAAREPGVALAFAAGRLTDEQFATAAASEPVQALAYAADRLTDEQFARAAAREPARAIMFATDRLTDEQFAKAIETEPWFVLKHANHRLTDEQFTNVAARDLGSALVHAPDRLTDEQFAKAIAPNAWAALKHANHRLTDEQFARAAAREPVAALSYAAGRLTDEQFATAALRAPDAARRALRNRS